MALCISRVLIFFVEKYVDLVYNIPVYNFGISIVVFNTMYNYRFIALFQPVLDGSKKSQFLLPFDYH